MTWLIENTKVYLANGTARHCFSQSVVCVKGPFPSLSLSLSLSLWSIYLRRFPFSPLHNLNCELLVEGGEQGRTISLHHHHTFFPVLAGIVCASSTN